MELVTIEHDRHAIYLFGSPYARKMLLPHVKRTERFEYLIGETKPNFPLPAIPIEAELFAPNSLLAFWFWYMAPLIDAEYD